jgi:hypothetical protein
VAAWGLPLPLRKLAVALPLARLLGAPLGVLPLGLLLRAPLGLVALAVPPLEGLGRGVSRGEGLGLLRCCRWRQQLLGLGGGR